jgi:Tfp pilus assembly protein PilO
VRPLLVREQILLWCLGLVALVAAFYLFVYAPQTHEAATLVDQLGVQRADVARLQKEAQRKPELEREVGDLLNDIRVNEGTLPSSREIPQLLVQLDRLAGRTGVTVTSIKPGTLETVKAPNAASPEPLRGRGGRPNPTPAVPESRPPKASQPVTANYQRFTVALETKGTFSATLKFVHGLEDFPRFLAITDMRLTQASITREENPADPVLSLSVTVTAYAKPEGVDVAAFSTAGPFVGNRSGRSENLEAAKGVRVAFGASVSAPHGAATILGSQASTAGPLDSPLPAAPSARFQSPPGAPGAPAREGVGRDNPFASLVIPQRPSLGLGVPQPRPGAPSFGIDLPLPPGSTAPGGRIPPPPGAGMKVGAIVGGRERAAIIQRLGETFIVSVGDHVGDAVVVAIFDTKVVMREGAVTFDLIFGGEGP